MTKDQIVALERQISEINEKIAALPVRGDVIRDPAEAAFQRRVDAVWGNLAAEEPDVRRDEVERNLRIHHAGD